MFLYSLVYYHLSLPHYSVTNNKIAIIGEFVVILYELTSSGNKVKEPH